MGLSPTERILNKVECCGSDPRSAKDLIERKPMATTQPRYSKEEFARRGSEMYEKDIQPKLKAADMGKFAAIDIESGEFAIDADELRACDKLRKRVADAQIWTVRIGYRTAHRFGGRMERRETS